MATSTFAGIGPALLNVLISSVSDSVVPLHFQLPPIRYCLSPSAAGSPVELPLGLLCVMLETILSVSLSFSYEYFYEIHYGNLLC